MSLWALIPVKPLNRAKSRLADVLTPEQRHHLAEAMYRQVLSVVSGVPQVTGVMVVSRDTRALAIARDMGARTLQESSPSALNLALMRATEVLRIWGANGVLILPADLPFITRADVLNLIELGRDVPSVVLATDLEEDGTNAMLVRPPGLFDYSYGDGSFERHVIASRLSGVEPQFYYSETLTLDIDDPDDLAVYNARVGSGAFKILIPVLPQMTQG